MTASRSRGREEKRPPGKTPVSGIHCVSDAAPPLCVAPCESALRSSSSSSSFAPREDDSSLSLTLPAVRENYNPSARVLLSLLVGRVPCIMSQKRSLMLYRVSHRLCTATIQKKERKKKKISYARYNIFSSHVHVSGLVC